MYMIYLTLVHGKMPLYPELFFELAGLVVPASIKAIIASRSGQKKMLEEAVNKLHEVYDKHEDFARQVHADHVRDKDRLFGLIERFVGINGQPLSQMAAPVGRTAARLEHFEGTPQSVVVDEPTAESLRTKNAEVGEMETYTGKILGVDKPTGTGKFLIDGEEKPVRCKITDPSLMMPKNVYTHALDSESRVSVTAKPVYKLGEISTLYVSDAKAKKRGGSRRSSHNPRK